MQGASVRLAIGRTIPSRLLDISRLLLSNRMAGVLAPQASAANAELHQLACVVPGDAPS